MNLNRAAKRYAKALLTFAIERGELEAVHKDVLLIQQVASANKELAQMMRSAVIQEEKKISVYRKVFEGKVSDITLNFWILLAKNSRSSYIPDILDSFLTQYKEHHRIVPVNITTANKMDENLKANLITYLKQLSPGSEIEVHETINKDLIGGFIFRTSTHQIDASVANRLKNLKRELYNTTYTSKL